MAGPPPLMLSVSGMRGLVGESLTPPVVARYAASIGSWLKRSRDAAHPRVVVGRDSRPSGPMYEDAAAAGLIAVGCEVVRVGVLSTPGIAVMVGELSADGGLVLTASHNPTPWNGVKPLRFDGVAPPASDVERLIADFHDNRFEYVGVERLQLSRSNDDGVDAHVRKVIDAGIDVEAVRDAKLTAVVDSVCGAGGAEAAALLEHLGVTNVHLAAEPTGLFPHPPEPTRENLTGLCDAVREHKADVGFAQDPDADRLAIVDDHGRYIGEEFTLVLCAMHLMKPGDTVAANLSTSRMIDDLAERVGAAVVRSPVGEANVAAAMREHGATVGGEGNGGIIWSPVSQVRDSLVGMAVTLEMIAKRRQRLSELVDECPHYTILKEKLEITPGSSGPVLDRVRDAFAGEAIDEQDGIRADIGRTWVHVRPSNTEPILRIIAEAEAVAQAEALVSRVRAVL